MSARLEVLSAEECLQLLARGVIGRVGITVHAMPEVLPVNFRLINGDIVFRTGDGTKLHAATSDAPIAFEVDESDAETLSGWSVLAIGIAHEVTDPDQIANALAVLPDGWVPGEHEHLIRVTPLRLSGRRLSRE